MNVWPTKVLPWAAFNVMDAVPVSLVVGVSTAMAEPARPNVDRLAAAAHIAARRLTLIWETIKSLLSLERPRTARGFSERRYASRPGCPSDAARYAMDGGAARKTITFPGRFLFHRPASLGNRILGAPYGTA